MFEVEYGCDVQNKFEDCAEASDPFELLSARSKQVQPKEKKGVGKRSTKGKPDAVTNVSLPAKAPPEKVVPAAPAKAPVIDQPIRQASSADQTDSFRGRGSTGPRRRVVDGRVTYDTVTFRRGGRGGRYMGGDRSNFPARQTDQQEPMDFSANVAPPSTEEMPRRPYRGRGGGRFGEGGRRQMDRHSGSVRTGVRSEEKRRGGGAHNWGKATEILDAVDSERAVDNGATAEQSAAKEDAEQKEGEQKSRSPSPVLMTLDEYREQQRKNRLEHKPKGRKAGEGEDPKRWAKPAVVYHKKPEEKLKYAVAEESEESSEEEEQVEEQEDERTKFERDVASKIFIAKPAIISTSGRRGARFENRDDNRSRDGLPFEIRRGRGNRGAYDRRPEETQPPKIPDPSEFPELC